jgi:hypothetical protein
MIPEPLSPIRGELRQVTIISDFRTQATVHMKHYEVLVSKVAKTSRRRIQNVAVVLALMIFAASFALTSFRLPQTVDINSDEATYAIESVAFYRTGMTSWNGAPFFVHPPLYYMLEGLYFRVLGVGQSPLFDRLLSRGYRNGEALLTSDVPLDEDNLLNAIMVGRYLSVFYGATIAAFLFLLGYRAFNSRVGFLAALLFMLDPYVLRRNHYNMLEPLATLFGVTMIFAYFWVLAAKNDRERRRCFVVIGVLFGLTILSKELALIYILAPCVHVVLFRRLKLRELATPVVIGLGIYALFPLWAALTGHFTIWWTAKTWLFRRVSGALSDTGITRPGATAESTFSVTLRDYWPSFLLLGLAGWLAAFFLYWYFFRGFRDDGGEILTAITIATYGFFVVVWRVGGVINEQFFYFLMPFTMLNIAYWVLVWPLLRTAHAATFRPTSRFVGRSHALGSPEGGGMFPWRTTLPAEIRPRPKGVVSLKHQLLLALICIFCIYNVLAWVNRYGFGTDNSYAQVERRLASSLPPDAAVIGRDLLDLYLLPKNAVYTFDVFPDVPNTIVPADIIEKQIPYTILNEQSLREGYGGANPDYYKWVGENGDEIYRFTGRIWKTSVYQIDYSRAQIPQFTEGSIAIGKPAFSSSTEDDINYPPQAAFDGRSNSRWSSSETDDEWIYVDLGERTMISRVDLVWEAAFARGYQLQVSDDAQDWVTFFTTNSGTGGFETVTVPVQGRYVRLLITARGTRYGSSLWEILLYP